MILPEIINMRNRGEKMRNLCSVLLLATGEAFPACYPYNFLQHPMQKEVYDAFTTERH